jgi:salicylate 5-hydroxylase large subunit
LPFVEIHVVRDTGPATQSGLVEHVRLHRATIWTASACAPPAPEPPIEPEHGGLDRGRIPFDTYTDEALYRRELERLFYRGHWCYVGLEAEVPAPGDFKRTQIGERSVLLTRDSDGALHVVENVCAHRGVAFCRERHGNRKTLVCPYHQWSYSLAGDLQGVPFRRGLRRAGEVQG